jgi:hypothetical protein
MPLSGDVGVILGVLQERRHGDDVAPECALIAGTLTVFRREHLGDVRYTRAMAVYSGQQHRARWRAARGGVVVGEEHTLFGECCDRGRGDLAAVGRDIAEAQVVGEDEDDVRPLGLCEGSRRA